MTRILALLFALISTQAFASPVTTDLISSPDGLTIQSGQGVYSMPTAKATESMLTLTNTASGIANKTFTGTGGVSNRMRGIYDFDVNAGSTIGSITLGSLPAKAIITKAWVDVITAPTSGGSATISFSANAYGDLASDVTFNAFPSGFQVLGANGSTINKFVKMTAASSVLMKINGATLTAGKFALFLDYLISQ